MNTELQQSPIPVDVLIAYDNVSAGKHAKELCDRLQRQLGPEYRLELNLWNLGSFQIPAAVQAVTENRPPPDFLIIALDGNEALPPFVRSWFGRWVRRTHVAGSAIVVQFHDIIRMEQELAPAYEELRHAAQDARRAFFSSVAEPGDGDLDQCLDEIHQRAHMQSTTLESIPHGV